MKQILFLSLLSFLISSCQDEQKLKREYDLQSKKQFLDNVKLRGKNVLALGKRNGLESEILQFEKHVNDTLIDFNSFKSEWNQLNTKIMYGWEPEMILVEGGVFQMGNNSGHEDEKPAHSVEVNEYYIGKYEVTWSHYQALMGQDLNDYNYSTSICPDCPKEDVSYFQAREFISKLNIQTGKNYRLPAESEWEFAARGGIRSKGFIFSGSNDLNAVAWNKNNVEGSHPGEVGFKLCNELGIYDMSGNVAEWCSDKYSPNYNYNPYAERNKMYVIRGGRWLDGEDGCGVSSRWYRSPEEEMQGVGFRLALTKQNF